MSVELDDLDRITRWRLSWALDARDGQLTPGGDWLTWLIRAGRGYGKTRCGAEDVAWYGLSHPGARIALVAETFADGRDTMVEGEKSGLLAVLPRWALRGGTQDTAWNRSLGELWFQNGTKCKIYSSERPDQLRGPQHHRAWCDELAKFKDAFRVDKEGRPREGTTWANLLFGLRLGDDPRIVATTTPRNNPLTRHVIKHPRTVTTSGTSYENLDNLAPPYLDILAAYEGTRAGRQEINAELLTDTPGALWTLDLVDQERVLPAPVANLDLARIVVAVDPAVTNNPDSDETGIVVAAKGADGDGYVIADRSARCSVHSWAQRTVTAYNEFSADRVVGEVNNGGDLVEINIRTVAPKISYKSVHASKGKAVRAEPISALYEQRRIHHVGLHAGLEDQMTTWDPEESQSPDRVDALVWALTELMLVPEEDGRGYGSSQWARR